MSIGVVGDLAIMVGRYILIQCRVDRTLVFAAAFHDILILAGTAA